LRSNSCVDITASPQNFRIKRKSLSGQKIICPYLVFRYNPDDRFILQEVDKSIGYTNEIMFFDDGNAALNFLMKTEVEPFIILSDINMPKLNGIDLREKIHKNEQLRLKSIPFLFFSTSAEQKHVIEAYSKSAQGFFIKPASFKEIQLILKTILNNWLKCVSPIHIK
jgi:CheY-like chemotaxis protein